MDTYIEKEQAKNPDTSSDTLEQVAKDRKNDVRMAVAYNSFASPKVLAQLATDVSIETTKTLESGILI